MKNIIIFTIDSPLNNFGGLGESIKNMCLHMPDYNFLTFGYSNVEYESHQNITHYKITDDLCTVKYNDIDKIVDIIGNEKISLIHVFDWTFADVANQLSKYLNINWTFTVALSAYHRFVSIYEALKPVVSTEVANDIIQRNLSLLKDVENEETSAIENSSAVVFVSEYYKSLYSESMYNQKFYVILNGIDLNQWNTKIEKTSFTLPGTASHLKILYLGRFDSMKNMAGLLQTNLPEGTDLILAGSSEAGDQKFVEDLLSSNLLPNVYHEKFLSGTKKKFFLQNVDAVIVPSIHEPFGIVALEAIASKTILICSRVGGMAEFISPDMCIDCGIYPPTIHASYLRLKNMSDTEKNQMKDIAFKNIQHLTWEKNANSYKNIYEKYASDFGF